MIYATFHVDEIISSKLEEQPDGARLWRVKYRGTFQGNDIDGDSLFMTNPTKEQIEAYLSVSY